VKRTVTAAALGLILLSSSPTSLVPSLNSPVEIKAIPPTFITLDQIPECIPTAPFPQVNPLPYFIDAHHIQFSCSVYDKDNVAWTMLIFYEMWAEEFGDPEESLKCALGKMTIVWGKDLKTVNNVYDMDGNFLETATVAGLMQNDTTVWVWAESEYISSTSFVHELTHIALHHTCGDADADHEGEKFPCWEEKHSMFVDRVNLILNDEYGL
tara:strand:- start:701 stop:1333 length:633 start_codon:yes stop_codon:yes gene_type:complete